MKYERCLRCNRKLKTDEAKELGFGPICWIKYNEDVNYKELFKVSNKPEEKEERYADKQ